MNEVQRVFERGGEGSGESFKYQEDKISKAMDETEMIPNDNLKTDGGEETENTDVDSEGADAPAEQPESEVSGSGRTLYSYAEEARQAREEGRDNHPRIAKIERQLQQFGHLHITVEEMDKHLECSKGNTRFDYNTNEIAVYDGTQEHTVNFERVVTYEKPYVVWD